MSHGNKVNMHTEREMPFIRSKVLKDLNSTPNKKGATTFNATHGQKMKDKMTIVNNAVHDDKMNSNMMTLSTMQSMTTT